MRVRNQNRAFELQRHGRRARARFYNGRKQERRKQHFALVVQGKSECFLKSSFLRRSTQEMPRAAYLRSGRPTYVRGGFLPCFCMFIYIKNMF